jgi:hypothetical protein
MGWAVDKLSAPVGKDSFGVKLQRQIINLVSITRYLLKQSSTDGFLCLDRRYHGNFKLEQLSWVSSGIIVKLEVSMAIFLLAEICPVTIAGEACFSFSPPLF